MAQIEILEKQPQIRIPHPELWHGCPNHVNMSVFQGSQKFSHVLQKIAKNSHFMMVFRVKV